MHFEIPNILEEKELNPGKHCVQFWQAVSLVPRTTSLSGKNKKPEGELRTRDASPWAG